MIRVGILIRIIGKAVENLRCEESWLESVRMGGK